MFMRNCCLSAFPQNVSQITAKKQERNFLYVLAQEVDRKSYSFLHCFRRQTCMMWERVQVMQLMEKD